MKLTRGLALVSLVLAAYTSSPLASSLVSHESRSELPAGWYQAHRASADSILPLRVGLKQPNLHELESLLLDVSHPESSNYGQHWEPERVASHFRPSQQAIDSVRQWLQGEGIATTRLRYDPNGWIVANVTVKEAESLLKTEYSIYEHGETGTKHVACGKGYYLPQHISEHVDFVTPTIHFDVKVKRENEFEKRTIPGAGKHIGQPGAGVVVPKPGGAIKVLHSPIQTQSHGTNNKWIYRISSTNCNIVTKLLHLTVSELYINLSMSLWFLRRMTMQSVYIHLQ